MKIYIVGTGMNGEKDLTGEAAAAVNSAELLIGGERMLRPFRGQGRECFSAYAPEDIARRLSASGCGTAAVLMSGDCGFFSGTKKLLPLLKEHEAAVIPGISSMSCLCARLGVSYEKMKFITLHGRASNIAVNVKMNERCFFLLGGEMTAADVCRRLCEYGMGGVTVHIGTDLGYERENILSGTAAGLADCKAAGLAVLITENSDFLRHIPSCIDDGSFRRGDIPMTKSEVRCIAVSRLNICTDSIVWDIGCGTGSVSVEAAYRCPDGMVAAFDRKPEAAALTGENARVFGCDNIKVRAESCPEALEEAPVPDKVFIGGSAGNMSGIFRAVHAKNPGADIAVTAVSLETLNEALSCFRELGAEPEIVQISAARTKKLGAHTMLQAQNPVFIISGSAL